MLRLASFKLLDNQGEYFRGKLLFCSFHNNRPMIKAYYISYPNSNIRKYAYILYQYKILQCNVSLYALRSDALFFSRLIQMNSTGPNFAPIITKPKFSERMIENLKCIVRFFFEKLFEKISGLILRKTNSIITRNSHSIAAVKNSLSISIKWKTIFKRKSVENFNCPSHN